MTLGHCVVTDASFYIHICVNVATLLAATSYSKPIANSFPMKSLSVDKSYDIGGKVRLRLVLIISGRWMCTINYFRSGLRSILELTFTSVLLYGFMLGSQLIRLVIY